MDPRAEPYGSLEDDGKKKVVILARSAGIRLQRNHGGSRN